jgi:hypothetical protein
MPGWQLHTHNQIGQALSLLLLLLHMLCVQYNLAGCALPVRVRSTRPRLSATQIAPSSCQAAVKHSSSKQ